MRAKTLAALIDRLQNPTSQPSSQTPPTKQTLSSDDLLTMMKTMSEMFAQERRETREMVLDILQGRATTTSQQVILPMPNEQPTSYDDGPLPPGIEAVMAREAEETLQVPLLAERRALQERLAELQTEMMNLSESEESSLPFSDNETFQPMDDTNTPR